MKAIHFIKNKSIFVILLLQLVSCIWYLMPSNTHAHVPEGFIKMIIFGGVTLFLLVITTILYIIYKPSGILWKISFMISIAMIIMTWFYDN